MDLTLLLLSPSIGSLVLQWLSPLETLQVVRCNRALFHSSVLLDEGKRKFRSFFMLYELANDPAIKENVKEVSVHALFAKAASIIPREKIYNLIEKGLNRKDIWAEADPNTVTLSSLVRQLTSEPQDMELLQVVLCTFSNFCTLEDLVTTLFERYRVPDYGKSNHSELQGDEQTYNKTRTSIQSKTINVLRKIAMKIGEYFVLINDNGNLLQIFLSFIDEVILHYPLAKFIKISLIKRALFEYTLPYHVPAFTQEAPTIKNETSMLDFDSNTLAHELILLHFEIFRNVKITELSQQTWNRRILHHNSPNVVTLLRLGHKITYWVSQEILSETDVRIRAKLKEKFVFIAQEALKRNAFHVSYAIMSGVWSTSVWRLKQTHSLLSNKAKKATEALEAALSVDRNYKVLREQQQISTLPALPYWDLMLRDLVFLDEGNEPYVSTGINLKKYQMINDVISRIVWFQSVPFDFPTNVPARNYILQSFESKLDEEDFYHLSLKLESHNMGK